MMRNPPFGLGRHIFGGKRQVREHARKILRRYEPETAIGAIESEFLLDLIKHHPNSARKIGPGIREFFVRINWASEGYENRCFWIRRTDDTETDFSYTECISPTDNRRKFLAACRKAIHPQIAEFRDRERQRLGEMAVCPISGQEFRIADARVDHRHPDTFESLVERFIEERNIDVSSIEIISGKDAQLWDKIADPHIEAGWCEFHRQHARFRFLPAKINTNTDGAMTQAYQQETSREGGNPGEALAARWGEARTNGHPRNLGASQLPLIPEVLAEGPEILDRERYCRACGSKDVAILAGEGASRTRIRCGECGETTWVPLCSGATRRG